MGPTPWTDWGAVATPPSKDPDLLAVRRCEVGLRAGGESDARSARRGALLTPFSFCPRAAAAGWDAWRALGAAVLGFELRLPSARDWRGDGWEKVPFRRNTSWLENWPRRSPPPGFGPRGEGRRAAPTVCGRRPDPGARLCPSPWAVSGPGSVPFATRGAASEPRGGPRREAAERGGEPGAVPARSSPRAIMDRKGRERCAPRPAIAYGTVGRWIAERETLIQNYQVGSGTAPTLTTSLVPPLA